MANAKLFKIDQADLMTGAPVTASLSTNLASGNYVLQPEIIALRLATSFRPAAPAQGRWDAGSLILILRRMHNIPSPSPQIASLISDSPSSGPALAPSS
ncbi:hypothetical protein BDQ12DRAFT_727420 [Crucibulum laeve]|uniref:Uncharacterized protein n=1 Tax=Crucibulum laeve TaxID=68775 RepID=A0A5C3LLB9_9AGAR|nr:hypothetical protein BDQ12DRAFT_727420 [Crucibulum laeve]